MPKSTDKRTVIVSKTTGEKVGLVCRTCGCQHFEVHDTRKVAKAILRVRRCRYCGRFVTTRETL